MPEQELAECVERIDVLVGKIERLSDPSIRQDAQEIVHCLLQYHGAALARLMSVLQEGHSEAAGVVARLADDELVGSLLLLHGLHPADLETRVVEALARVRPFLESHGGNVELASIVEGVVQLRLQGSCHGCPSSTATLKSRIEQAIYEAAPEVAGIEVVDDSRPAAAPNGFVALDQLTTS
jgi:Fe-S cluster biogenesis protein NfuA